jgi:tetratricopeptide (TPR) repeat protein
MTNDDELTEAIRLIKAGEKEAARFVLEPFLHRNPNHVQAWLWETELFPSDGEKIRILEICLRYNPGHPQVIQALNFFKKRVDPDYRPVTPAPAAPPAVPAAPRPAAPPAARRPAPSVSPFSVPFEDPFSTPPAAPSPVISAFEPELETPNVFVSKGPPPAEAAVLPSEAPNAFVAEDPLGAEAGVLSEAPLPQETERILPRKLKPLQVLLVGLACLAVPGLYLGGGYYLNGQINQSFAGRNCAEVVQQAAFPALYPRGIFASLFTGYDQAAQCRFELGVEQAAAAKNWKEAFSLAQQSLAAYPAGPFAASLSEQAPQFLSTWSEELIASHDYAGGLEKLKQLREAYPDSPLAQSAAAAILQTDFLWAKELTEKQNYKEAEQRLKAALAYFETDAVYAEPVKQELVNLYVGWGDRQVQQGDIENGIGTYQKAEEISPGKAGVELLIARANLQKALEISKTKNFDKALAKVKEVSEASQAEDIQAEAKAAREKILTAYSNSTSLQALDQMTAAIAVTCQGQRPDLPIFGLNPEKVRFGLSHPFIKLPADWAAETPGQLHYVLCINDTDEEIETCHYTNGHDLTRMRYLAQVTLYDILTGEAVDSKTIPGADPRACPATASFVIGSANNKFYGPKPAADQVIAWLAQLNLAK